MANLKWENMNELSSQSTERARTPGGWLVKFRWEGGESVSFVNDPDHRWQ